MDVGKINYNTGDTNCYVLTSLKIPFGKNPVEEEVQEKQSSHCVESEYENQEQDLTNRK